MIQMTRCTFDLSGEKTNFKPWILVLIMKLTVISFHVGLSRSGSEFWRALSFSLGGPRAIDSDTGGLIIIAGVKTGTSYQKQLLSSPPKTPLVYTQQLFPRPSPDLSITKSR